MGGISGWLVKGAIAAVALENVRAALQRVAYDEPLWFVARAYQTDDTELARWAIEDYLQATEPSRTSDPGVQSAYDVYVYAWQMELAEARGDEETARQALENALNAARVSEFPGYHLVVNANSLRAFARERVDEFAATPYSSESPEEKPQ